MSKACYRHIIDMHGLSTYDYGARQHDPILGRWDRIDPLAEKYYSVSPYVYCGNNPVIRIDVDGLYDTLNVVKGDNHPVIVVLATKLDDVSKTDYDAAKQRSMPILQVDNIEDMANALSDFANENITFGCVTFNSHGSIQGCSIGSDKVNLNTDLSSLKDGLEGKDVVINACRVGISDGLVGRMAEQTGVTIYASKHKVFAGYKYNGKETPHLNGEEGTKWTKAYSEVDSGINLTTRETVRNLSIHKTKGVNYQEKRK